eukprot:3991028-Prymnesium_polylepis.1
MMQRLAQDAQAHDAQAAREAEDDMQDGQDGKDGAKPDALGGSAGSDPALVHLFKAEELLMNRRF